MEKRTCIECGDKFDGRRDNRSIAAINAAKLIEIGAAGLAGADLPELAALIAKRQEKNSD